MSKRNLVIAILTDPIPLKPLKKRYLPKVCHKVGELTMLERVINTVLKLEPYRIILIVNQYNIKYINRIIKDKPYQIIISLHMDNQFRGVSVSKRCYQNKNLLVVPGTSPLITSKTLFKMIDSPKPLTRLTNNLWYIHKKYLEYIDRFDDLHKNKIGSFEVSEQEIMEVNTYQDLKDVNDIVSKRNKPKSLLKLFSSSKNDKLND